MSILRPYQTQGKAAFRDRIETTPDRRLAEELATGLGKTVMGSDVAVDWGGALVLTHTDEITSQWETKLRFAARKTNLTVGVVKAGRDEFGADLVVASVATLQANPGRQERIGRRAINVADECHHAVAPSWMTALDRAGAWDGVPTLGLTATLARSDGQGLGHVWEDMVFSRSITWAQRKGYLLDVTPWRVRVPDLNVAASDEALDAMLADSIAPELVVDTWLDKCPDRPSTVLFAPLVKSATAFRDAFLAKGIRAEVIHGASKDRDEILAAYERGDITVLCNAMVLTEGWDSPRTMCVIWGRKAAGPLFIQGVGRGLRPWDGVGAPAREDQRCVLIMVTDPTNASLNWAADLSDSPLAEVQDGQSLLEAEDEYNIGAALDEVERAYRGQVRVEEWDLAVRNSSKAWKATKAGAMFLPTAKRSQGYVFVVGSTVYAYGPHPSQRNRYGARKVAEAPDVSLAMSLAEDEAQERGGDLGALLADKSRAWRKAVPSVQAVQAARLAGATQADVDRILALKSAGKAGKLSDLTDTLNASRTLDTIVRQIQAKGATA